MPLAERCSTFADERERDTARSVARECHRHPGNRQGADGQRRRGGKDAVVEIADVKVLSVHRRSRLRHLRGERPADGFGLRTHRDRQAQIADQRRNDVSAPRPIHSEQFAAAQPDPCGINRFLTERSESLALKGGLAVADLAVGEQGLQPIVGGAGQHHASKDLEAFVGRQRRADSGSPQESVAGLDDVINRLFEAPPGCDTRRGLGEIDGSQSMQPRAELAGEGLTQRLDGRFIANRLAAGSGQRLACCHAGKRVPLENERTEFAPQNIGSCLRLLHPAHRIAVTRLRPRRSRSSQSAEPASRRLCARLPFHPQKPPSSGSIECGSARQGPEARRC